MDWPDAEGLRRRFAVMTAAWSELPAGRLLDLGCGAGLYYDYLIDCGALRDWRYRGIDLSPAMIAAARARHPQLSFERRDLLAEPLRPGEADAVVMNGVLTEKRELPHAAMWALAQDLLRSVWAGSPRVLAFNVMSAHLDWCRPDLFHLPLDWLLPFLRAELSPHVVIRQDYGLHEYTVWVRDRPWS
jgi:SAM-dependent methyltransferase